LTPATAADEFAAERRVVSGDIDREHALALSSNYARSAGTRRT